MSMVSLDLKKIKILTRKQMCAGFLLKGLPTLSQLEPLTPHGSKCLGSVGTPTLRGGRDVLLGFYHCF